MSDGDPHVAAMLFLVVLAIVVTWRLLLKPAPYGRHAFPRGGAGRWTFDSGLGWFLMELPAAATPALLVGLGGRHDTVTLAFLAVWESHYFYRALIYPWLQRGRGTRLPAVIALAGGSFNVVNAYVVFAPLTRLHAAYAADWLLDPRFVLGGALFYGGLLVNRQADGILRGLRQPGERDYRIPFGGLYRWVSCPNYLGELIQWCGFALLTWSWGAAVFALFTAANLVPRALAHHADYRRRFPDYPAERRALLPVAL
jgi:protein-S-isoprenylcysteine O-methyltransferase Ste14